MKEMTDWNLDNPFDLGIWDELGYTPPPPPVAGAVKLPIPSNSPPRKNRKLSLQLNKSVKRNEAEESTASSRFVSLKKDLESYQKGYVPRNTTSWATKNFRDWLTAYNSRHSDSLCPEDILLTDDARELSFWLQKFINKKEEKW